MEQDSSSPLPSPSSSPAVTTTSKNHWSLFSQEATDQFASPQRGSKNRASDGGIASNYDAVNVNVNANELTSLLLPPPRSRDNGITSQRPANRDVAAVSKTAHDRINVFKGSSHRLPRRARPLTPVGNTSCMSSDNAFRPLLLQSMRHWDVALPPIKKHVVEGKLVETFRGSLYGNDRTRNLPVAKRKLTIELFGHDTKNDCRSAVDDFVNDASMDDRNYELAERDIVILRVMKSKIVTPYDDEFGLGHNSINGGLKDRKWESQSMSDRTMSWMVGSDDGDGDYDRDDNASFSSGESLTKNNVRWIELSRTRLSQIELVREDFEVNEVDLKMGVGARTVVQTFRFDDVNDYGSKNRHDGNARTFVRLFRLFKRLQKERAQRLAAAHRSLLSELDELEKQGGIGDSDHENARRQESNSNSNSNSNDNNEDCNHKEEKGEVDEIVSILMEIVSANNLPPPEERTSESHGRLNPYYTGVVQRDDFFVPDPILPPSPYVVIRDGNTDVHTTSFIADSVNPVWTLSTGCLCLLQSNLVDFFERSNVLEFTIKTHKDAVGVEHQTIGTVMVHKTELLNGTGERKNYQILRPPTSTCLNDIVHKTASNSAKAPYLYLRYRQASMEDIEFMKILQEEITKNPDEHPEGVYSSDAFLAPQLHTTQSLQRPTEASGGEDGKIAQYHVKPSPDPNNMLETEWMTETQIEDVSKDHSTSWTMAGSGSIGKLYIEIIGCDGLTNPAQAPGYKIDPFVNIVFENSIVNTSVIQDCLSPRWMPWSQRSFAVNMIHLSSQLFIGVFDYNSNQGIGGPTTAEAHHHPLGRTAINLSNLRARAIHTLTYNLYDSDDFDRKFQGTITIRLRLAITNERRALLSELSIRDHCYVSTVTESDFRCASYSLANNEPPILHQNQSRSFSLQSLKNYEKELLGYVELADYIKGALTAVLLWRGHFPVILNLNSIYFYRMLNPNATGRSQEIALNIPLHSMVAFSWATVLAWNLEKCFSFFWFAIGWALLAALEDQRRHPSPWRRPRSYAELLKILLFYNNTVWMFGRPPLRRIIHPNESLGEIERFESYKVENAALRQKCFQKSKSNVEHESMSMYDTPNCQNSSSQTNWTDDGTTALDTGKTTSSDAMLAHFESILFPIQKILCETCRLLRISSSVFSWKDSYLAFWITSLSFSASLVAFWIPWVWLIQWGFRLFAWPLFGPWMKLADVYYFQRAMCPPKGEEHVSQSEAEILKKLYNRMLRQDECSAVYREKALKVKDTKRYMFGKFSMRVPNIQEEGFPCEPAISSSSVPYNTNPRPVHIARRIHGQYLKGDMVPYRNYSSNDGVANT